MLQRVLDTDVHLQNHITESHANLTSYIDGKLYKVFYLGDLCTYLFNVEAAEKVHNTFLLSQCLKSSIGFSKLAIDVNWSADI